MNSVAPKLQAHHHELQKYLSEWSKTQQQLLETMSAIPASPGPGICIQKQELEDPIKTEDASKMMAPVYEIVALANGETVTYPALAKTADHLELAEQPAFMGVVPSSSALDDLVKESDIELQYKSTSSSNPECEVVLTTAGKEQLLVQKDEHELGRVEICRNELVGHFENSLQGLKDLDDPTKDEVEAWLKETLESLEIEMSKIDLFESKDPEPDVVTPKRASALSSRQETGGACPRFRRMISATAGSQKFETVSAIVILVNGVVMGISADYQIKNLAASESKILKNMEIVFFSYYVVELLLRLLNQGRRKFFFGADLMWNWFDFGLVLLSTYDIVEPLLTPEGGSAMMNVSFLRLSRLLKMAKLLRMFRLMKMFKHLRLILASILGSIQAVFWAGLLVGIVNYMASVLFVNLLTTFLMDENEISSEVRRGIEEYWSSVSTGMNSLYASTTGGADWLLLAVPLREAGWGVYFLFLLYMGFFLIVILNTFASLFLQAVMENEAKDEQAIIEAELEKKDIYIEKLQEFYDQIDENGNGSVSMKEFLAHADDPKLHAWANHLDIDLTDAKHFFELLSQNGAVTVDIEAFVTGCIKLRGNAKSIDMMSVYQLSKQIAKTSEECELMLHAKKGHDLALQKFIEQELAEIKSAGSLLQILNNICRSQEKLLALTWQAREQAIKRTSVEITCRDPDSLASDVAGRFIQL